MKLWDKTKQEPFVARLCKWLKNNWDICLAGLILTIGGLGYLGELIPCLPEWGKFCMEIRSELVGIGLSVLIITTAGRAISRRQEKERLILQMGSPDNAFAREAVRQLEVRGWLQDGSLSGAYLIGADLRQANLILANLFGADLSEVNLGGATLSKAILSDADLSDAYLVGADLSGADLSGSNLSGADLSMTIYDKYTTWPKGFDPVAAGAELDIFYVL